MGRTKDNSKIMYGLCPDEHCKTRLYFPVWEQSIVCTSCGQRHDQSAIRNIEQITNPEVALGSMLRNILLSNTKPKKGVESVKVLGLSNYQCKLLSPFFTTYGVDKQTGTARLLREMGQGEMFDCAVLGNRAFQIDAEHVSTVGFGRDVTANAYLNDILNEIRKYNDDDDRLIPIHADSDGHCLVHAISRALVGRELFWHPLRENLFFHFNARIRDYRELFRDFIDVDEWKTIINECKPDFLPLDGEPLGLRNIHIFGLANVLKRPIILLDSLQGLRNFGDYSGLFLPGLVEPTECQDKDGVLNKPLCIAWSSPGRNHYIPLVGVKGRPPPKLPQWMLPQVWGLSGDQLTRYVQFDGDNNCVIAGEKSLQDRYIQKLVRAMEDVFMETHKVHPTLVADVHQYLFKSSGIVFASPEDVLDATQRSVSEGRLYRCLTCGAITEFQIDKSWLVRDGHLYQTAVKTFTKLDVNKVYTFPVQGLVCNYNPDTDCLEPELSRCKLTRCGWCHGQEVRLVKHDGSVQYINGDYTSTPAVDTKCQCGFKHFWDGNEYDNLPEKHQVSLEWNGEKVEETVYWWQFESNPSLNSNVFDIAQKLVQKHFPGEFGSERLVQKVVDILLLKTASKDDGTNRRVSHPLPNDDWKKDEAMKTILTGAKKKTLHKEELSMSDAERLVKRKVEVHATLNQKRKTAELAKQDKIRPTSPKMKEGTISQPPTKVTPIVRDPSEKRIRIQTSDGRQVMLSLDVDLTYSMLQERITKELNIPAENQRVRYGFPPQDLTPPTSDDESKPLALKHGDKILVEIKKVPAPTRSLKMEQDLAVDTGLNPSTLRKPIAPARHSWGMFEPDAHSHTADQLLDGLDRLANVRGTTDSIDMSIKSLELLSTLAGRDLWTHVQGMPHLFSVGGPFYQQVERDLGLADGKHCTLPTLPGKVFRFNKTDERLELCLEPHGHFPVEPGIEDKVLKGRLLTEAAQRYITASHSDEHIHTLASGSSGVSQHHHVPFSGQGHSMTEDTRMPQDLLPRNELKSRGGGAGVAGRFHELAHQFHPDAIVEDPEEVMDVEPATHDRTLEEVRTSHVDKSTTRHGAFKRVGPGYTVLDEDSSSAATAANTTNSHAEMLKLFAQSIDETIQEEEEEQDQMDSQSDQINNNTLDTAAAVAANMPSRESPVQIVITSPTASEPPIDDDEAEQDNVVDSQISTTEGATAGRASSDETIVTKQQMDCT
ncbi:deubiquitinating protein VCPIP1-like [Tubulanus polymorphus]|uniref:deubiquitinating protein VCPIP1-like n=1 Tax=Tubulanus polymorphus TaxID=672921 RepID=UPI003DA4E6C6